MFKKAYILILISLIIISCSSLNSESAVVIIPTQATQVDIQATPSITTIEQTYKTPVFILSQAQNGITTAITWSYIDKYRLAFEVYIYGINAPTGYDLLCPIQQISIVDKQGYVYDSYENGNLESNSLSTYCIYQDDTKTFRFTYNSYHKKTNFQETKTTIMISLGNFEIYNENGQQAILPDFGTYTFNLVFPSNEQLTIEPNISLENSSITATLQRVEINPSFTSANLCLQLEDHHGWYPEISIINGDENISATPELTLWTNYDPNVDWYDSFTSFRCYKFTFPITLIENSKLKTKDISILLNNIVINYTDAVKQEECTEIRNEIQSIKPDLDFVCHIDYRGNGYGFGLEIKKIPSDMSTETAYHIVEDSFKKVISGPWLFSINLH